jgi:hypothetical protein
VEEPLTEFKRKFGEMDVRGETEALGKRDLCEHFVGEKPSTEKCGAVATHTDREGHKLCHHHWTIHSKEHKHWDSYGGPFPDSYGDSDATDDTEIEEDSE